MTIRVQTEDFDVSHEMLALRQKNPKVGAVASFVGVVRDINEGDSVATMTLEHYPGMTEKCIADILQQASGRWPLMAARVVHRVGDLSPGEQIVWVGVASRHRAAAFSACEFIMDYLKTRAPFWKKEQAAQGSRWVDASLDDEARAQRWQQSPGSPE